MMGIEFHLAANILGIFCFIFFHRIDLPLFSSPGCCHANCAISPPLTAQTEIRLENRVPLTSCCHISHLISPSLPSQCPVLPPWLPRLIMPSPGSRLGMALPAAGTAAWEPAWGLLLFSSSSSSQPSEVWGKYEYFCSAGVCGGCAVQAVSSGFGFVSACCLFPHEGMEKKSLLSSLYDLAGQRGVVLNQV